MPPNFLEAVAAGERGAVAARTSALEQERVNLQRLALLAALAPVEGLTPEDVSGVLKRDPDTIARLAAKKGGMKALKSITDIMPREFAPETMVETPSVFGGFRQAMGLEPVPVPEGLPPEIPAGLASTITQGAATIGRGEIAQKTGEYTARAGETRGYYNYRAAMAGQETEAGTAEAQAQEDFNKSVMALSKRVGETSFATLTNLQYPAQIAQSISAKLEQLAQAQMTMSGTLGESRIVGARLISTYGLKAGLSKGAMREIEAAIDSDLEDFRAMGLGIPAGPEMKRPEILEPPPEIKERVGKPIEKPAAEPEIKRVRAAAYERGAEEIRQKLRAKFKPAPGGQAGQIGPEARVIGPDIVAIAKEIGMTQEQLLELAKQVEKEYLANIERRARQPIK